MYAALDEVLQSVRTASASPNEVFHRSTLQKLSHAEEVDELLRAAGWPFEKLRMTREGSSIPSQETHDRFGNADMHAVWTLFGEGASIVLHSVESRLPQLSRLCRQISSTINGPSWVNAYISPPNAGAFARHADDHHVLVQQICGHKNWSVEGAEDWQLQLAPGDLLYLPRGRRHQAWSSQCVSVHLSIGFRDRSFKEVAMSALSSQARFAETFDQDRFRDLEGAIAEESKRQWAVSPSGLLREIEICSLNDTTVLQVTPACITVRTTSNYIHVGKGGRVTSLPRALEYALAPLLSGRPIRLASLHPVLDPEATRKIAALLVREEIATLVKEDIDG
jgi:hypothetical protein